MIEIALLESVLRTPGHGKATAMTATDQIQTLRQQVYQLPPSNLEYILADIASILENQEERIQKLELWQMADQAEKFEIALQQGPTITPGIENRPKP